MMRAGRVAAPVSAFALAFALALAAFPASPIHAQDPGFASGFARLREQDALLQRIGWKLASANAPFCARTRAATGLLVQDAAAYGAPAQLRALLGLRGDIFIQSVVPGSPADRAGLVAGDEILAIDGQQMGDFALDSANPWKRALDVDAALAASLAQDGTVELETARSKGVALPLTGTPICAARFELLSRGESASADGERVAVGRDFAGLAYPEPGLAAALSHELAHVVLGHQRWLEGAGRSRSNIRKTEREADRLMPWLLANAGYDPAEAARFIARWGPRHGGGLFRKRTHDGWDERVEFIEAELPLIAAARSANGGVADWASAFQRGLE